MAVSAAPYFLRPKTILQEFDLTQIAGVPSGTTAFVNGEFRRGSAQPYYVSGSLERFSQRYGDYADPTLSFAYDTSSTFLASKGQLLINRVIPDDAMHGLITVLMDEDLEYGNRLLFIPSKFGRKAGYAEGSQGALILKIDAPNGLVTANKFTMDITDGQTVDEVSQVFVTNHATTMAAIASSITATMSQFGSGGYAEVFTETSSVTAIAHTIIIFPPTDATLEFSDALITLGASQSATRLLQADTNWFMDVPAENPGKWSGDIGIRISALDEGIRERFRLTFTSAMVADNEFSIKVNGVLVGPIVFGTTNDDTLTDIAVALKANALIRDAYVETTPGSLENDRRIVVVAETPGIGTLEMTEPTVEEGVTQPAIFISKFLTGAEATGSFVFGVYARSSPNLPIERYTITPYSQVDGAGNQIQYESIVNGKTNGSYNVRMVVNPAFTTKAGYAPLLTKFLSESFQFRTTLAYLGGGEDGSAVFTSQLIAALAKFEDRVHYPVNMLLNAGYTATAYQQALVVLANNRNDCTAILDMPSSKQEAQAAFDYRMFELNVDNSFGSIYSPDILVSDITTSEKRFIPPSGMVAAAYVYNDNVGARWSAPAGFNRGKLRQALGFRVDYSPLDEEMLHPVGVNCLVDRPGVGPVIMGEQTLQYKTSALSSVHVRRLVNLIETTLVDGLDYTLFEPQTEATRYAVVQLAESVLSPIHRRDGLYGYHIVCDETNNTPDIIDADTLALDVYIKPVRAIKGILLRAIITKTGTSFELISAQFTGSSTEA